MIADTRGRKIRIDLQLVADMVAPESRLLDVGCGDGELLEYLFQEKNVDGRGIELSMAGVNACVSQGLPVIQGDADTDLNNYPDKAFDYVVLSQTLQATRAPKDVLENLLRIGERAIVSFPNFAHWRMRLALLFKGRMPRTETLPYAWYDTPNIHFCTIRDFIVTCEEMNAAIERGVALNSRGGVRQIGSNAFLGNLLGEQAIFLLRRD